MSLNARITIHLGNSIFKLGALSYLSQFVASHPTTLSFPGICSGHREVLPCWHGWKSRAFQAFALLSHIQSSDCASPVVVGEWVVGEWGTLQFFMFSVMADLFGT